MEHTYNYLKSVIPDIKQESKSHPVFLFTILVLLAIPLSYGIITITQALFVGATLATFRKSNLKLDYTLLLPIALFLLMAVSLTWTEDLDKSVRALQKGLPLFLIPASFLIFPNFTTIQRQKIIGYFSIGMVLFSIFWTVKAAVRFLATGNPAVFFYHELVMEDVNAIHVSVYIAIAIFHFVTIPTKRLFDKIAMCWLMVFLILLSSKNIIIVFALLVGLYYLMHFRQGKKIKAIKWILLGLVMVSLAFIGKIKDRFMDEFQSAHSLNHELSDATGNVYNVSIAQAWTQDRFYGNDYFPGTAFRVYQLRIFKDMLQEDAIFFTGYGLNAAGFRIKEKGRQYGVYPGEAGKEGYTDKNFHNEYVQVFAELGVFGLLLLLAMLAINLKNALRTKDFVHISFAILMISLFLTESFLSRQRGIVFFTIMYCLFNSGATGFRLRKE